MDYKIVGKGKNWTILDDKGKEVAKAKSKKDAEAIVLSLSTPISSSTPETPPEVTLSLEEKRMASNKFTGKYLLDHPEADMEKIKNALIEAEMKKLPEYIIEAWIEDMKWIPTMFEEAGWTRPKAD